MQDQGTQRVTAAMVKDALKLQGVEVPDADVQAMVAGANQSLTRYEDVRKMPSRSTSRRRFTSARWRRVSSRTARSCHSA